MLVLQFYAIKSRENLHINTRGVRALPDPLPILDTQHLRQPQAEQLSLVDRKDEAFLTLHSIAQMQS